MQPTHSHDSSCSPENGDSIIRWSRSDSDRFREAQVDLFASHESSHWQLYYSLTLIPASRSLEPPCVAPGWDAAGLRDLPPAVVDTTTSR